MYFLRILPINIRTRLVTNSITAVERLPGQDQPAYNNDRKHDGQTGFEILDDFLLFGQDPGKVNDQGQLCKVGSLEGQPERQCQGPFCFIDIFPEE